MDEERTYGPKGTTRGEYLCDRAQLDGFKAIESDWRELFRWLMSVGMQTAGGVAARWHDHVLTVLVEIACKDIDGYRNSFIRSRGTVGQESYTRDLEAKIRGWIARLDNFLRSRWQSAYCSSDPAADAAAEISARLANALRPLPSDDDRAYYHMLSALDELGTKCDEYVQRIERNGDMDPAFALLLTYVRNYASVAERFDERIASLPEFFRREILHAAPLGIEQDRVSVVVEAATEGFTLPAGTAFPAGETAAGAEIFYETLTPEYISPLRFASADAVFRRPGGGLCRQPALGPLFVPGPECGDASCGWLVESRMFSLNEGTRSIALHLFVSAASAAWLEAAGFPGRSLHGSFILWISGAEGWRRMETDIEYRTAEGVPRLSLGCTIPADAVAPVPCDPEIHGMQTEYPVVRMLTGDSNFPDDWAPMLRFTAVEIETGAEGISGFDITNLLGPIDPSQPFYPFGPEAERGSWFVFGSDELRAKPLREVSLRGTWSLLPETGFAAVYKDYGCSSAVTDDSFRVTDERQQDGEWQACSDAPAALFRMRDGRLCEELDMEFAGCEACGDGRFRVTLIEPAIGFGTQEFRRVFTDVMFRNSRLKQKKWKPVPSVPVIPMLATLHLRYKASVRAEVCGATDARHSLRLASVGPEGCDACPVGGDAVSVPLVPSSCCVPSLYLRFSHAAGEGRIRFFLDLARVPAEERSDDPDAPISPVWELFDGLRWLTLPPEAVLADQTCGLTRGGCVELRLPEPVTAAMVDRDGGFRLRMCLVGEVRSLCVSGIHTNYIRAEARNGDGSPLPAGTIRKPGTDDPRIAAVGQPLPSGGGRPAETAEHSSVRQSSRIATRNRAVAPVDYERLVLGRFLEIGAVHCIPAASEPACVVPLSHMAATPYPSTPGWMLARVGEYLAEHTSPCAEVRVCNPVYRRIGIVCRAALKKEVSDPGQTMRRINAYIAAYFAPWLAQGTLPELGRRYSYKELHTRLANDPDIRALRTLIVDGRSAPDIDVDAPDVYIDPLTPREVLVPAEVEITLVCEGVGAAEIEADFRIA